jgi:hypothetical protein
LASRCNSSQLTEKLSRGSRQQSTNCMGSSGRRPHPQRGLRTRMRVSSIASIIFRFANDSPLEGSGFELSVPLRSPASNEAFTSPG